MVSKFKVAFLSEAAPSETPQQVQTLWPVLKTKKKSTKCVVNWIPVVVAGLIGLYLDLLWGLTGSLLDRNRSKT